MKIAIFGAGYVGLTAAACLSLKYPDIYCVDTDREKIERLQRGESVIDEPGLTEILNLKKITFTSNDHEAITEADVILIATGTPVDQEGQADLSSIYEIVDKTCKYSKSSKLIVIKSTVPVGTTAHMQDKVQRQFNNSEHTIAVAHSPEFLRQGRAVYDFMHPSRIIFGCDLPEIESSLRDIFVDDSVTEVAVMDSRSSEMTKLASNAYLAARISFLNEISEIGSRLGAKPSSVIEGMGMDPRIGNQYTGTGMPWGGMCLPKDLEMLMNQAESVDCDYYVLDGVEWQNNTQRRTVLNRVKDSMPGRSVMGKKILVLGISFSDRTDDIRNSPSLDLVHDLKLSGAEVTVFDSAVSRKLFRATRPKNIAVIDKIDPIEDDYDLIIATRNKPGFDCVIPDGVLFCDFRNYYS